MLIVTDRNLQTLTIVSNDYPDGVHFQDDKFNENLETGTCMLTCSIDKVVEKDVELIEAGCLIVATGYKKKPVLLEITEVIETRYSKEIVAEDCGLDLLNEDIAEQDFKGTLAEWVNNTLGEKSDWVVGINEAKDKNLAFKFEGTTTKTKRLAMIAGRFGCEISYDVKLNGNAIDKKVINFYKKRGKETGYRLEFGRDVSDVKRTVSIADLCTAVRPVGKPHKEKIREVKQVEIEEDKKKPAPNSKIELFVKWMKSREGKVRYSQARREGPNYYDCSSSVSSAAKFAGLFPKSVGLPTTETLWAWGNAGTYFHQIKQSEIQYGDIFVSRYNGKGHTGVILDKNTIIHCTLYGSINGIVTTKLNGWTGPNVRFYRWNENKGGTIIDATKKTYWTNSDVTKHDLGKRLQGITATQINNWIRAKAPNSPFNGQGQVFIEAQKQSGLDARYILAHAALESAWGTSRIARTYHNYFGINAYDSNPDNAKKSSNRSLQAGIINGAVWIKEHYYNRGQKTLYAMNHDSKGHNYASDKAWGDKIANIMKGSERFTNPGATASSTEQVTYKEHEVNTDLVGYKYDDGRFYVTDDGLICDREAAKKWTRFNKTGQKYFIRMYDSEATSQKTLFDEGLRFLKNNNEAKISYEVSLRQLPSELEIGDYIRIIDHGFKPALYLSARLVDITRSLCDELSNSAIFANFEEQKAGISERLLSLEKSVYSSRFNWQNVPFEMKLSSSQGNVFKDGVLSTEITAIVTKAGVDQTATIDKFIWERVSEYQDKITTSDEDWNKSKEGSVGNILGINNTDVDLQATFTCSAMLNDVAVATSFITIKDLTIGIYKQEKEPDRASLSWGDVWQWDDGKGNHFKRLWKGDRWEDTITKRDLEILELTPGPPGADGEDGMPGKDGKDGRTSYVHFAYADSEDGTVGFTRTATAGKKYIGFYTDFEKADSTDPKRYEWSLFKGDDGKDGVAGKNGVGLKSTDISYGLSDSETKEPTSWTKTVPNLIKGKYLWTKTVWNYTDKSSETGYTKTYIAKDGNTGRDGIAGKDGVGIKSTTITYAKSRSGTSAPTSSWTSSIPNTSPGDFLWTKTVWSYTDNTSETGYSVGKIGKDGSDGIPGKAGVDGKTPYLHIAYSNSQDGSKDFSVTDSKRDYIGTYTDFEKSDSTDYRKYSWSKIKGEFEGEIGGRNYLLKSGEKISNANYNIAKYDLAEKPTVGETYTCTLWGNLAKEKSAFGIYNSSGSIGFGNLVKIKDGVYQRTFKWYNSTKLSDGSTFKVNDTELWVYALYMNVTGVTSTIDRIKLEKGTAGTDWTPAPEDFEDELEKKADSQTVTDIESRQQAVEVLISQKADKDSVTKSFVEIEKAKAYADTVKKALENENLSLKDRIKIIEENVGAGKFTIDAITTYFDFGEEGILIGKKDEAVKMILKNNALEIIDGTKTVARFANSQVQVPNLKVDGVLEFGYHMVTKYDNGTNKYTIIKPI
ncbi:bacteriophage peptidoglycan hydrolase [Finegoldia magna SY403409CC001050417]|uniref:Phage tail protein n=1 Tax=Finegoldia magna TaxID=1260 RepID=A0A7D4K0V7_FINMA|nr:phage tail spike protein [Finegoldia magna]EGS34181.1 bacteriophage peptidoglycan hydrolase [Finegoldia magna SY403409CC001050417]QKH79738.1 phage tail protein [Finegoldia magna]QKH79775.1 phage tail protein [Finegoldia magna]